jgi:hypothetical protein
VLHHLLGVAACGWFGAEPPAPILLNAAPCFPPCFPALRLPAAKCYSCLRVFCTRAHGPQPTVMSCALSETMTVAGMHDGIIRLWRTEDVFAGVLTGNFHRL